MAEESRPRNLRNPGREIQSEELRPRNPGGGVQAEVSTAPPVPEWIQNAADCALCIATLMLYAFVTLKTIHVFKVYSESLTRETLPEVVVTPSNAEVSN